MSRYDLTPNSGPSLWLLAVLAIVALYGAYRMDKAIHQSWTREVIEQEQRR